MSVTCKSLKNMKEKKNSSSGSVHKSKKVRNRVATNPEDTAKSEKPKKP